MNLDDLLQLQQPLKDGGIRSANFFNGRLLTAGDLTREQRARREGDARLGLAIGDGVATGLQAVRDVAADSAAAPVLRVAAGLAVNRAGQTLRLLRDTSVALARRFDAATSAGDFAQCATVAGGTYVAGAGVYLLTIAPALVTEGRAQSNGLDPTAVRCNTDATVDAVQFRLVGVSQALLAGLDVASPLFRNLLAYRAFGTDERAAAAADPWRRDPDSYGLVDALRSDGSGLGDSDVPLALLYWTAAGLQFVDNWAARRPLLAPDATPGLAFQARRRRTSEAQAMCAQFADHLADAIAAVPVANALVATDVFRWLPPFGTVPLEGGASRGVAEDVFFAGIVHRPAPGRPQGTPFIDARLLGALREQALAHMPVDLTQQEFVWLYRPWQNVQAAAASGASGTAGAAGVVPVRVFASGLLPPLAQSRADMARFDFSNAMDCCGGP